ncbi:polysaccharide deacetylase family protein [Balneola sp. MJW-20]|uniref:polysaccharide deacetylase family protein n=1 Tax=Gracilimonas aurantiaca TaxID=3234185 RepID=UPI003465EB0A
MRSDPVWESIMDYLGVDHKQADLSEDLLSAYSLIIVNAETTRGEQKTLIKYVKSGGAILEMFGHEFYYAERISTKFKRQIYDQSEDTDLKLIPFLDFYSSVHVHKDQEYFEGLIHFKTKGKGSVGFAGFDLPSLISDLNFKRKRFISDRLPFPDELVSKVSKGYLLLLFRILLQKLHFLRDLPFLFKHYSRNSKPYFAFRIDTDFGDKDSINALLNLSRESGVPFTWFLHVKAHEEWLEVFKKDPQQELALHSYVHATSDDLKKIDRDLNKAQEILRRYKIDFKGFAAPYGILNNAVKKALERLPVNYSSEFSYLYDALPMYQAEMKRWQIPIHPICTGSMSRLRYSLDDMKVYFLNQIREHQSDQTPLILYHHPMQKGFEVWDEILKSAIIDDFNPITMEGLRAWYNHRSTSSFSAVVENDSIRIECDPQEDLCFNISREIKKFDLLKFKERTVSTNVSSSFKLKTPYTPPDLDIKKNRRTDINLIKTGIIDSRNRKYL